MRFIRSRPVAAFYFSLLLVLIPLLTVLTIFATKDEFNPSKGFNAEAMVGLRLVELSERVRHSDMLNKQRKREILDLKRQLDWILAKPPTDHNGTTQLLHDRTSVGDTIPFDHFSSLSGDSLQIPSIVNFLPHLLSKDIESLQPAFKLSQNQSPKTGVTMVIGVPTVKRPVESYLLATLTNLIDNMNDDERQKALIIVFIAETDVEYVMQQASEIQNQFSQFVTSGLLEVISPPAEFYPNFTSITEETLGDPLERVKWRTKQNLDFAFLMMYAQPRGTYYIQLEDDVLSKPGFITKMERFIYKQAMHGRPWVILDFCQLGFIGKMFKSVDLSQVILFFIMFHEDQPVDWLLLHLTRTRYCSIDMDTKQCRKVLSKIWLAYRPSLFQHIGTHSSLKGKVQKLKDRQFGKLTVYTAHRDNPPAEVSATFKHYKIHSLRRAYNGDTFFWGMEPKVGDAIEFHFRPPVEIESFFFRSGSGEHPHDKLVNTTIEILPDEPVNASSHSSDETRSSLKTDDGFYVIGAFKWPSGLGEGTVARQFGRIQTLRLRVHSTSGHWVILSEMWIRIVKTTDLITT